MSEEGESPQPEEQQPPQQKVPATFMAYPANALAATERILARRMSAGRRYTEHLTVIGLEFDDLFYLIPSLAFLFTYSLLLFLLFLSHKFYHSALCRFNHKMTHMNKNWLQDADRYTAALYCYN
jgi:hypothetical protein